MAEAAEVPEGTPPSAAAALVRRRVRRIAERAFWDSAAAALADASPGPASDASAAPQGEGAAGSGSGSGFAPGAAAARLAALLAELGAQLDGVVPQGGPQGGPAAQLRAALDQARVREALLSGQVCCSAPHQPPAEDAPQALALREVEVLCFGSLMHRLEPLDGSGALS